MTTEDEPLDGRGSMLQREGQSHDGNGKNEESDSGAIELRVLPVDSRPRECRGLMGDIYAPLHALTRGGRPCAVRIPDTVVLSGSGRPLHWYFTSAKTGRVMRRNRANCTASEVLRVFLGGSKKKGTSSSSTSTSNVRRSSGGGDGGGGADAASENGSVSGANGARKGNVVAVFYENVYPEDDDGGGDGAGGGGGGDEHGLGSVLIHYLDAAALETFLSGQSRRPEGVLQKFVEPLGARHSVLQATWTPRLFLLEERTNINKFADKKKSLYERLVTFEGAEYHSRSDTKISTTTNEGLRRVCTAMARHLYYGSNGPLSVRFMTAHFKIGRDNRLYFLWLPQLKLALEQVPEEAAAAAGPVHFSASADPISSSQRSGSVLAQRSEMSLSGVHSQRSGAAASAGGGGGGGNSCPGTCPACGDALGSGELTRGCPVSYKTLIMFDRALRGAQAEALRPFTMTPAAGMRRKVKGRGGGGALGEDEGGGPQGLTGTSPGGGVGDDDQMSDSDSESTGDGETNLVIGGGGGADGNGGGDTLKAKRIRGAGDNNSDSEDPHADLGDPDEIPLTIQRAWPSLSRKRYLRIRSTYEFLYRTALLCERCALEHNEVAALDMERSAMVLSMDEEATVPPKGVQMRAKHGTVRRHWLPPPPPPEMDDEWDDDDDGYRDGHGDGDGYTMQYHSGYGGGGGGGAAGMHAMRPNMRPPPPYTMPIDDIGVRRGRHPPRGGIHGSGNARQHQHHGMAGDDRGGAPHARRPPPWMSLPQHRDGPAPPGLRTELDFLEGTSADEHRAFLERQEERVRQRLDRSGALGRTARDTEPAAFAYVNPHRGGASRDDERSIAGSSGRSERAGSTTLPPIDRRRGAPGGALVEQRRRELLLDLDDHLNGTGTGAQGSTAAEVAMDGGAAENTGAPAPGASGGPGAGGPDEGKQDDADLGVRVVNEDVLEGLLPHERAVLEEALRGDAAAAEKDREFASLIDVSAVRRRGGRR